MFELSGAERQALRARSHRLDPVVIIGDKGLTPQVLSEVERALAAHRLIKVRAGGADRTTRAQMLAQLVHATGACAVQQIGKVFVLYRRAPPQEAPVAPPTATRSARRGFRSASARPAPGPRPLRRRTSRSARGRSAN